MANIYSDLNSYTPTKKPILKDVESIYQSIYNILGTRKGEILFRPEFGLNLSDFLFDLMDESSSLELLRDLTETIESADPRVTIDPIGTTITPDYENHKFSIELMFDIEGYDDQTFELTGEITQ